MYDICKNKQHDCCDTMYVCRSTTSYYTNPDGSHAKHLKTKERDQNQRKHKQLQQTRNGGQKYKKTVTKTRVALTPPATMSSQRSKNRHTRETKRGMNPGSSWGNPANRNTR